MDDGIQPINFSFKRLWKGNWEPHNLFHETTSEYSEYDKPDISLFGTSYGCYYDTHHYTVVGDWFEDRSPLINLLLKLPYYLIAWPLYFLITIVRGISLLIFGKYSEF